MLSKEKPLATIHVFTCRRYKPAEQARAAIHPSTSLEGIPGTCADHRVLLVSGLCTLVRPWPAAFQRLWAEAQGVQFPGLRGEPPPPTRLCQASALIAFRVGWGSSEEPSGPG